MSKADIGVVGLGVMGHNLALNMERNGFSVIGFDVDAQKAQQFIQTVAAGKHISLAASAAEMMAGLEKPRRVLMMVPAGPPVDSVIKSLKPLMEAGDILIDGGNSFFEDTNRRCDALAAERFHFIGMGVSGGEEGALRGPSLMPGGPKPAYDALAPILTAISAKATEDNSPCVANMGPRGAGHYVKMVHNGIEYGVMQLIAEAYDILHRGAGLTPLELSKIFADWNQGALHSYLFQITADILAATDPETGKPMVDIILDEAEQKGTGEWTAESALNIGAPAPTINVAVETRVISSLKDQRMHASQLLSGPQPAFSGDRQGLVNAIGDALRASLITTYAQGFNILGCASSDYQFGFDLREIARIWRAGCIIRAGMLNNIMDAYQQKPSLDNLMLDGFFRDQMAQCQTGWRAAVQQAVGMGIPVPGMTASLAYYDGYRSAIMPANLIQAQRDFFGAHTYHRVDKSGVFHTQWEG